ncbi:SufD family Fe-S cluster assembly protein [Candidatus Marsarchaeota archaeon]|nr:SufD family Fe-S cluster assembly protein [Candidatus Marsarchaeota archaeon]MCL5404918.1 SufD family Fe-S cluster assembly protein [Candidatus Marsarchaeota archaeon]
MYKEDATGNNTIQEYDSLPDESNPLYSKYFIKFPLDGFAGHDGSIGHEANERAAIQDALGIRFDIVIGNGVPIIENRSARIEGDGKLQIGKFYDKFWSFADSYVKDVLDIDMRGTERPLNILFCDYGQQSAPTKIKITVEDNSVSTINEFYFSRNAEKKSSSGTIAEIKVGNGAKLELNEVHNEPGHTNTFGVRYISAADNSIINYNGFYTGGSISRQRLYLDNAGEGSKTEVNEVVLGTGEQKFDIFAHLVNAAKKNVCYYDAKAVLADNSYGIVKSLAKMEKGAEGSESRIIERGIIYDKDARIILMPDMSIDENYVKASHSSSTSPISDDESFYLQSRGIDTQSAKFLIASGLVFETLKKIENPEAKIIAMGLVKQRLVGRQIGTMDKLKIGGIWF